MRIFTAASALDSEPIPAGEGLLRTSARCARRIRETPLNRRQNLPVRVEDWLVVGQRV